MPYTTKNLPDAVKALPSHARKIWMSAFNAASKQYDSEERAFQTAWSAIAKAGYKKKGDRWVRMKEAEPDDAELTDVEQAWVDGAVAGMIEEKAESLTEEYDAMPSPQHSQMRMALHGAVCLLADSGEALTPEDKDALAGIIARMARRVASDEGMTESVSLEDIQEGVESLIIAHELSEAGQRHRDQDYRDFDIVLDILKKLRGQSPKEVQADQQRQAEEDQANDPHHQMLDGYHAGQEQTQEEAAVVMTESAPPDMFRESVEILREATGDGSGKEWEVRIIQAGVSKNNRTYPLTVLKQAAPLFDGARVYTYDRLLKGREIFDHLTEEEVKANPSGYAKDLVGYLKNPRIDGSSLMGTLVLFKSGQWLGENLKDALSRGLNMPFGLSIDAGGDGHMVGNVLHVDAIKSVRSVDVVTHPAAGGGFVRLVASQHPEAEAVNALEKYRPLLEKLQTEMHRTKAELRMSGKLAERQLSPADYREIMDEFRECLSLVSPQAAR